MEVDSLKLDSLYSVVSKTQAHADSIEARLTRLEPSFLQQGLLLENFGSIYSTATMFLGFLTFLLAIGAFAIPYWVNRVSIQPAKALIDNLEKKVTDSVAMYLDDSLKTRIAKAIADCISPEIARFLKGASTLRQLDHEAFPEHNIKEIIEIIDQESKYQIRASLLKTLLNQDSDSIEAFAKITLLDQNKAGEWEKLYEYLLITRNKRDNFRFFLNLFNTSLSGASHLCLYFRVLLKSNTHQALTMCNYSSLSDGLTANFKFTNNDLMILDSLFNEKNLYQQFNDSTLHTTLIQKLEA